MFAHQNEYIFKPIVNEIISPVNDKMKMIAAATGSGKTHVLTVNAIPHIFEQSLADIVIFSTPNSGSMGEVEDSIRANVPGDVDVVVASNVFGEGFAINPENKTVVVCHPTWVSTNKSTLSLVAKHKRIVGFCDEAHVGFQAEDEEQAKIAYGRTYTYYPAEWNNAVQEIDYQAWFLITATPRNTVECSDYMELLSECFDLDVLAQRQKRCSFIVLTSERDNSATFYRNDKTTTKREHFDVKTAADMYALGTSIVDDISREYGLPKVKRAALFQGSSSHECEYIWNIVGAMSGTNETGIAISNKKRIFGKTIKETNKQVIGSYINSTTTSTQMIDGVNNKNIPLDKLIANNIVGNAVNIQGATMLFSTKTNKSIKDLSVTQGIEQLLGRMIRWPDVDGLECWDDVAVFRQEKIDAGVPEEKIDQWINLVFGYVIIMPETKINIAGINAFFGKHTLVPGQFEKLIDEKYKLASEGELKKTALGPKSPWAQPGDLKYRLLKGEYCEYCPQENGIPKCASNHAEMGFTKEEYIESLDVNHWDGDHLGKNVETICANVHRAFTKRYGHANNLKYRNV